MDSNIMKQAGSSNRELPQLLSLRLSASILGGNDEASEILLPREAIVACCEEQDESSSLSSRQNTVNAKAIDKNGNVCELLSVRSEQQPAGQYTSTSSSSTTTTHLFKNREYVASSSSSSNRKNDNDTSSRAVLLVVQPVVAAKELKQIGSKVRARLEAEKSKRAEIQMLDMAPPAPDSTKGRRKTTATSSFFLNKQPQKRTKAVLRRPAKKQKTDYSNNSNNSNRRAGTTKKTNTTKKKTATATVQQEAPDTSHIPLPEKQNRSIYVRLHGLPLACTMDHIKKLFTGLPVKGIFILFRNHAQIPQLDTLDDDDDDNDNNNNIRDSYHDATFRIIVKFNSAPVATLAAERSGETIQIIQKDDNNNDADAADDDSTYSSGGCEPKIYSIGVTQLTKSMAILLSRLAVPASPEVSFQERLLQVQGECHSMVDKILWSAAARDGNRLAIDQDIIDADIFSSDIQDDDPRTLIGYQRHARQYNRLVTMQDELLSLLLLSHHHHPSMMMTMMSAEVNKNSCLLPTMADDPVARLTYNAYNVLSSELDRVEALLYHARVSSSSSSRTIV